MSGVDTCFWQGGCSKLNLGTPIIFLCSVEVRASLHILFLCSKYNAMLHLCRFGGCGQVCDNELREGFAATGELCKGK